MQTIFKPGDKIRHKSFGIVGTALTREADGHVTVAVDSSQSRWPVTDCEMIDPDDLEGQQPPAPK